MQFQKHKTTEHRRIFQYSYLEKISLFKPKKNLCEICSGYVIGQISEDVYNEHIQKKKKARAEKQRDKKDHKFVFTADLQAVLLAPFQQLLQN